MAETIVTGNDGFPTSFKALAPDRFHAPVVKVLRTEGIYERQDGSVSKDQRRVHISLEMPWTKDINNDDELKIVRLTLAEKDDKGKWQEKSQKSSVGKWLKAMTEVRIAIPASVKVENNKIIYDLDPKAKGVSIDKWDDLKGLWFEWENREINFGKEIQITVPTPVVYLGTREDFLKIKKSFV